MKLNNMENLNSVCFVSKISLMFPIEGADKIELAQVEGWTSIVQKGIHKVGDKVLCITTDAVIPDILCEKWGVGSYLRKGNRVRTIRLKGAISECIFIPLPSPCPYNEGKDMMKEFNIFKYEPPVRIFLDKGGRKHKYKDNPHFHVYYKFPNQKNVPNMFKDGDNVVISRKLHGTNARYGWVKKTKISLWDKVRMWFGKQYLDKEFVVGSHNVQKGSDSNGFYDTNVWQEVADKYKVKEKLWDIVKDMDKDEFGDGVIIYGEIYGPGIQGSQYHYNQKQHELALFDIEINNKYLGHDAFMCISHMLNLPVVEILHDGPWTKEVQDSFVLNQFIEGTKTPHEGVVVKCVTGDRHRVSKVINPDYLIFGEKHNIPDSH